MSKNIFVLWSGGLDSTYLIHKLLKEGHKVTAGYIQLLNNEVQSKRELRAIENLEEYFTEHYRNNFVSNRIISSIELKLVSNNLQLTQAFVWPFVLASVHKEIDEVAMGYVLNDCAVSFLDDIRNVYKSFAGLLHKEIPVTFPIIKMNKDVMWKELPRQLQVFISWCESDREGVFKCGHCLSCKRMIDVGIMAKDDEKLQNDIACKKEFLYLKEDPEQKMLKERDVSVEEAKDILENNVLIDKVDAYLEQTLQNELSRLKKSILDDVGNMQETKQLDLFSL